MKKILMLATAALALPFLTSCADYASYGYGTVGAPIGGGFGGGGFGGGGFVGGGLAPLQVGFVATTFDQWAYDPFRRAYFDRRIGRFWDPRLRSYCNVAPRRFATPIYPAGFRRGSRLACPTFLPRHTAVAGNGGRGNLGRGQVVSNRGRYSPVVHGSSRGSTNIRSVGNYDRRSSGTVSGRGGNYRPSGYTTPTNSRGSVSNRGSNSYRSSGSSTSNRRSSSQPSSSPSRYQTVGTTSRSSSPVVRSRSTPTVRSQPAVRTQPVRSSSVRSSSYTPTSPSRSISPSRSSYPSRGVSRSTSTPSRSIGQARQRTR